MRTLKFSAASLAAAEKHLRRSDPVMRTLIKRVGPCTLTLNPDRFQMLVWIILAQQLSTKAARSIRSRLERLVAPNAVTPESLCGIEVERLRTAGLSGYKAAFILELANAVTAGDVDLAILDSCTDEEAIGRLTSLRGIGVWSAKNFLMFSLGRLDVFPHDDVGLIRAIQKLYDFSEEPTERQLQSVVAAWRPYATVGSWYCWRSLDLDAGS